MQSLWDAVQLVCTVVGAWVLVAAVLAGLWAATHRRPAGEAQGISGRERRAQSWDEVPGWVARDREWAVAVVLLGAPSVAARTDPFVSFADRTIDWPGLLLEASSWAEDDRLLIYTAYDLAAASRDVMGEVFGAEHVTLQQMVDVDDATAARLQVAMDVRRGRCDYLTAVVRAGGVG
jgi:hypothetical protein